MRVADTFTVTNEYKEEVCYWVANTDDTSYRWAYADTFGWLKKGEKVRLSLPSGEMMIGFRKGRGPFSDWFAAPVKIKTTRPVTLGEDCKLRQPDHEFPNPDSTRAVNFMDEFNTQLNDLSRMAVLAAVGKIPTVGAGIAAAVGVIWPEKEPTVEDLVKSSEERMKAWVHLRERAPCQGAHNNPVARQTRDIMVGRKNHHGSKSQRGTEVAALFYSPIETARLREEDPGHYLQRAALAALENPGTVTPPEESGLMTTPAGPVGWVTSEPGRGTGRLTHGRAARPGCAGSAGRLAQRVGPRSPTAHRSAVVSSPVACRAEEEHLPALGPAAHHEAQCLHGTPARAGFWRRVPECATSCPPARPTRTPGRAVSGRLSSGYWRAFRLPGHARPPTPPWRPSTCTPDCPACAR